jgi:hypothetical protein
LAGASGNGKSNGASVKLYLYDQQTSALMVGNGSTICGPCTFDLSSATPKRSINIGDVISTNGGFSGAPVKLGFGVIVVSGDADNARLQGFVVNSHTGPFDLSVFGFEPQPIAAAARVIPPPIVVSTGSAGIGLGFDTLIGYSYTLENKSSLDSSSWSSITRVDGDGASHTVPVSPAGTPQNYFRLKVE